MKQPTAVKSDDAATGLKSLPISNFTIEALARIS
jgi:hypothetical protein